MPSTMEFMGRLLEATFPDIAELGLNRTSYGYTKAFEGALDGLGVTPDSITSVGDDLYRLIYELDAWAGTITDSGSRWLRGRAFRSFPASLGAFRDRDGAMRGWVDGKTKQVSLSFEAAVVFTYLLTKREASAGTVAPFAFDCLSWLGIEKIGPVERRLLESLDWGVNGDEAYRDGARFNRIGSKGIVLVALAVLAMLESVGVEDERVLDEKATEFRDRYRRLAADEMAAHDSIEQAMESLSKCVERFEPRSIQVESQSPEDFFVAPRFSSQGVDCPSPFDQIACASSSVRKLVVAQTGLGKTSYLRATTLCILRLRNDRGEDGSFMEEVTRERCEDLVVVNIPARMFTFCWESPLYKAWTDDLVGLFFQCMWNLYPDIDFFSDMSSRTPSLASPGNRVRTMDHSIKSHLKWLASKGKLLVIADSFDEVPSGEQRDSYRRALSSTCDTYGHVEGGGIGAHVIVSSRQMSPDTMMALRNALELSLTPGADEIRIEPLNKAQQRELLLKWNRFKDSAIADNRTNEQMDELANNHFYSEFASNPYMLSVACFYFQQGFGSIIQRLTDYLVNRVIANKRNSAPLAVLVVLQEMKTILQDVAGESVVRMKPHISRRTLSSALRLALRRHSMADLSKEDENDYIEQLHNALVTEVGLIVPADGDDDSYQFINEHIRYELASKGIQREVEDGEREATYRDVLLPSMMGAREFARLAIPLVCDIKTDDYVLAEQLVSDLAMFDYANEDEDRIILEALTDLALGRYDTSIITVVASGGNEARSVRRAQRELVLRLLSSPAFNPTDNEKAMLGKCPALAASAGWLTQAQLDSLRT